MFFRLYIQFQNISQNSYVQMAKRKAEFSLDDLVADYLKNAKCERTLKLFEDKKPSPKKETENICERFMNYLMKKESERENESDDLGFEINFGVFPPETKVRFTSFKNLRRILNSYF